MLEEKLKDVIVAELKRQAADNPDAIRVQNEEPLVVNGTVDLNTSTIGVAQLTVKEIGLRTSDTVEMKPNPIR